MTVTVRAAQPVPSPAAADWERAVELLASADSVALACHISPDGDALGSMLALAIALDSLGKSVTASWGSEPFAVPAAYASLSRLTLLSPPTRFPARPPLLVTFDTGSQDRLGVLAPVVDATLAAGGDVLVVDHHASNTGYGSVHLVDATAAATAVLVDELLRRLGVDLTADIAAALYTGLATDTGCFKFVSTTPATHELAGRLLATGFRHDLLSREIWDTNSFGYVRLLGDVLGRAELEADAAGGLGLVWTCATAADMRTHGVAMEQLEGVIDILRTSREAEVAVVCKQDLDGAMKVSTRSKGRIDVGAVCVALGGGGHRFAAGFTAHDDATTTMAAVRKLLADAPHLPA
ncbi:MAG: bifunctional oligoribonuclease/PAP phosphatase NrnA [Actinomycetota bacterium]|nr:bifunctional oligoribonuclease/PAP phosphatase NrnA [Actinomycetota bacterium]